MAKWKLEGEKRNSALYKPSWFGLGLEPTAGLDFICGFLLFFFPFYPAIFVGGLGIQPCKNHPSKGPSSLRPLFFSLSHWSLQHTGNFISAHLFSWAHFKWPVLRSAGFALFVRKIGRGKKSLHCEKPALEGVTSTGEFPCLKMKLG